MPGIRIGEFELSRVQEMDFPMTHAQTFFPEMSDEMLCEVRRKIPPGHLTGDGKVIFSFHSYVVRSSHYNILVDTCCGNDKERPGRDDFSGLNTGYLDTLAAEGLKAADIDYVMCTHLHWDHVGWNTRLVNGEWVLTFPNAQVVMAKREYDFWNEAYAKGTAGIHRNGFEDSILPIVRADKALLVADDFELDDGIWLEPCHGHSAGHVVVNLASGDDRAVLTGDVIHHLSQLVFPTLSTMADTDTELARVNRTALIEKHAGTGNLVCTAHFKAPSVGRIEVDGDGFRWDGFF